MLDKGAAISALQHVVPRNDTAKPEESLAELRFDMDFQIDGAHQPNRIRLWIGNVKAQLGTSGRGYSMALRLNLVICSLGQIKLVMQAHISN